MGKVDKVEIDTARLQNVNKKELQTAFAAQDVSATNWVEDSSEPGLTACINSFREGKDTINMAITNFNSYLAGAAEAFESRDKNLAIAINDFSLKKSFNEKMESSRSDKKYSCHIIPYDRGDQKQIKIEDYTNIVFYSYPF